MTDPDDGFNGAVLDTDTRVVIADLGHPCDGTRSFGQPDARATRVPGLGNSRFNVAVIKLDNAAGSGERIAGPVIVAGLRDLRGLDAKAVGRIALIGKCAIACAGLRDRGAADGPAAGTGERQGQADCQRGKSGFHVVTPKNGRVG